MKIEEELDGFVAYDRDGEKILSVRGRRTEMLINKYEGEEELFTIETIDFYNKDVEQGKTALKEIFYHIRDEFDRYPGIDNHFGKLDEEESNLISALITNGDIPKQLLLNAEQFIASPNLSDKEVVRNLIDSTADSRNGSDQSGYLPYNSKLIVRDPRSYAKDRFPQILRQMATQLYHFCRHKKFNPVEVQVMYFNNSLFISANIKKHVGKMHELLSTKQNFQEALTTAYSYKHSENIDKKISARHARKLSARLYGEHPCNDQRFSEVQKLFTTDTKKTIIELPDFRQLKEFNATLDKLSKESNPTRNQIKKIKTVSDKISKINATLDKLKENNTIYFVCDKLKEDRHAEENLMDIINYLGYEVITSELKPAIFGKKRPCFTCHARMERVSEELADDVSQQSVPFEFNPNKGMLFKNAAYRQIRCPSSAEASAASLGSYNNVIHTSKVGDYGYATVSDSEFEDETDQEVNSISLSKMSMKV